MMTEQPLLVRGAFAALCLLLSSIAPDARAAAVTKSAFEAARVPSARNLFGIWKRSLSAVDCAELRGLEQIDFTVPFPQQTGDAQVIVHGTGADGSTFVASTQEGAAGVVITRAGAEFDLSPNFLSGRRYRFRCRANGTASNFDRLLCRATFEQKTLCYVGLKRGKENRVVFDGRSAAVESSPAAAASSSADAKGSAEAQLEGTKCFRKADYEGARTAWKECRRLDPNNAFCLNQLERLAREYGPEP